MFTLNNDQILVIIYCCVVTIVIEGVVAMTIKAVKLWDTQLISIEKLLLATICCNILTNPILNLYIQKCIEYQVAYFITYIAYIILFLELLIVVVEAFILRYFIKNSYRQAFIISLTLNLSSWFGGKMLLSL